ncbi:copper chaperone PCu(A)C [Roseobacter weihaiensis]|uniref:hypothetical protein n=1 Tax=Roseobacter weihaiensis TaxID=2763262 RepID=UPI001D0A99B8|nr:hypothetical protein [Roseobacter sp. H9]
MQNTKIITALLFGLVGFWALTLVPNGEATHLFITDTAAHSTYSDGLVVTFAIENRGAPDRIIGASSSAGEVSLQGVGTAEGLPVPAGSSALTLEAGHIRFDGSQVYTAGQAVPLQLILETAGPVSLLVRSGAASAEEIARRMSRDENGVTVAQGAPSVSLAAHPDGTGWRVDLEVENFVFDGSEGHDPQAAARGFGHLYLGGTKVGRMASETAVLGALPRGTYPLRVVLRAPDGTPYFADGALVAATLQITVP